MQSQECIGKLLENDQAFAWRAGTGPLHAAWGPAGGKAGPLSLHSRYFSPAEPREDSIWSDFLPNQSYAPANHFLGELNPAPLEPFHLTPPWETLARDSWDHYCALIDASLRAGSLQKLVPARPVFHPLQRPVIERLRRELPLRLFAHPQEGSYRFLVKQNESTFFGASPELLFRREGGKIFVPAIAGTRAHGPAPGLTPEEAGNALLASAKDRSEQALVTQGIAASLRGLGLTPRHPAEPTILRARNLVHLYTPIEADDPGIPAEELIEALHPTPAVGGTPKAAAREFISLHEPWSRGLFASPLLFSGPAGQICVVAIRSGLLDSSGLHFFAGAGYVKGSTAEGEWEETARKFESLRGLLKEGK